MIRVLTAPARAGGKAYLKVVSAGVGVLARVFTKVLGGELLGDLSSFVAALESMFGGFRERAQHTYELLKTPGTAFVVVAAPEPDALREASYFVERLSDERMPLAGLVVNRVRHTQLGDTPLPRGPGRSGRRGAGRRLRTTRPSGWPKRRCASTPSWPRPPSTTSG